MRIGIYIDGYNVYYAGHKLCGRARAGWRWLDLRAMTQALLGRANAWPAAEIAHIVYCTARIDATTNPSGATDQDVYLKALRASGSVDHIEYGHYVARVKYAPLATKDARGRPQIVRPRWPIGILAGDGAPVHDATFMVSYAHREEKGSDVNVATLLLVDVLESRVDAVLVVSNDSDLRLPVQEARRRVPVAVVNPGSSYTAGALSGAPDEGVGRHWWATLTKADFLDHQLPGAAGGYRRPDGW
jgi:hypothetical protein